MNRKQRRTFGRAVNRILKSVQENTEYKQLTTRAQLIKENRKWWTAIVVTIVLGIPTFLGLRAHPSVSLESPLDPKDVYSTPLVISNDGILDLNDVRVATLVIEIQYPAHKLEVGNIVSSYALDTPTIGIGEKKTVLIG